MDIPLDEWTVILSFMNNKDLARLGLTCHAFYDLTEEYIDPTVDDNTPIVLCCCRGYLAAVNKLLVHHISRTACTPFYRRVDPRVSNCLPLRAASMNGRTDVVKLLLTLDGLSVNEALVKAAERGHKDIVKLLLDYPGCDPSYNNHQAIVEACMLPHTDITEMLLPYGYNDRVFQPYMTVDMLTLFPTVPSDLAVEAIEANNIEMVEYLLSVPELLNLEDIEACLIQACRSEHLQLVKLLLTKIDYDPGAILIACENGSDELLAILLDQLIPKMGAIIIGNIAIECLNIACRRGYVSIVNKILPFFDEDSIGTAMEKAARAGHEEIVRLLSPHCTAQEAALRQACQHGRVNIAKLLADHATCCHVDLAASRGHRQIVEALRHRYSGDSHTAYLAASSGSYGTFRVVRHLADNEALLGACNSGCYRIFTDLIRNPSIHPTEDMLCRLCSNGFHKLVKLLLTHPDVEPRQNNLVWLARNSHKTVKVLLKDGRADPSLEDNRAIRECRRHKSMRLLLNDPRTDPTARNHEALRLASNSRIVDMLLRDGRCDPSVDNNVLIRTCHNRSAEVVKLLVADPRVDPSANNYEAVTQALQHGRIDLMVELLAGTTLPYHTLRFLASPSQCVEYAVLTSNVGLLRSLVAANVNLSFNDSLVLVTACGCSTAEVVEYLLHYCDPYPRSVSCFYALYRNNDWLRIAELLIEDGRASVQDAQPIYTQCYMVIEDMFGFSNRARWQAEQSGNSSHQDNIESYNLHHGRMKARAISLLKKVIAVADVEEHALYLYRLALRSDDVQLLRLLMSRVEPGEFYHELVNINTSDECMRALLLHPSMEP